MEFISFFIEDGDGVVYEMATVSPMGTKQRLAPRVLHEGADWIAAVLVPLRREKTQQLQSCSKSSTAREKK